MQVPNHKLTSFGLYCSSGTLQCVYKMPAGKSCIRNPNHLTCRNLQVGKKQFRAFLETTQMLSEVLPCWTNWLGMGQSVEALSGATVDALQHPKESEEGK